MTSDTSVPPARVANGIPGDEFAIIVVSDIVCPWSHVALHRLDRERRERGLEGQIKVDHRAYPLELVNGEPTAKRLLDAEVAVCSQLEPDAGWRRHPDFWTCPMTSLPALEAVQAAKTQGAEPSTRLDLELRRAVFGDRRCVSFFPTVLDVARGIEGLDVDQLWADLRSGVGWTQLMNQLTAIESDDSMVSPTFILPDGSVFSNPGVGIHWDGEPEDGELVVDHDDPGQIGELVERTLALLPAD
jgi:predicted DsbA family dithiol-disulfide isomerase